MLKMLGDELRAEHQRLEAERRDAAERKAALGRELTAAQKTMQETLSRAAKLSAEASGLRKRKGDLEKESVSLYLAIMPLGFESRRLDLRIKALEIENEEMRRVLSRRPVSSRKAVTPTPPGADGRSR
jgi:uncharacterized coiled-coil DUF342 family protein